MGWLVLCRREGAAERELGDGVQTSRYSGGQDRIGGNLFEFVQSRHEYIS